MRIRVPPPGVYRMGQREPSVCRWVESMPRFGSWVGTRTMAPAPSPKRMQVFRSLQSVMLVRISAPTTSATRATPEAT